MSGDQEEHHDCWNHDDFEGKPMAWNGDNEDSSAYGSSSSRRHDHRSCSSSTIRSDESPPRDGHLLPILRLFFLLVAVAATVLSGVTTMHGGSRDAPVETKERDLAVTTIADTSAAKTTTATRRSLASSTLPSPSRSYEQDNDRAVPLLQKGDYNLKTTRERFHNAHLAAIKQLADVDYGPENYARMFVQNGNSVGFLALRSAGLDIYPAKAPVGNETIQLGGASWDRLKRKCMLKLLEVQQLVKQSKNGDKNMVKFVWASGGHSAAAAHGDLYNESYSAVIERFVRPAFQELGIYFQGKNYAMGGTESGPEVALCVPAIFGLDVDALSWDFGMTDAGSYGNLELYFRQASLLPNRPALVAVMMGGSQFDHHLKTMRNLEKSGAPALYMPPTFFQQVTDSIPDAFGLSNAELQAMPPFVRSYKCEGAVEKGSPGCSGGKWTHLDKEICESGVKYRTAWHPGWKWHALVGNLVGSVLLEIMEEALADIAKLDMSDPKARYNELKALEDKDYEVFANSKLAADHHDEFLKKAKGPDRDFNVTYLFMNRAICHTALLPAETRYLGILTESSKVGFFNYDKGMSRKAANKAANDDNEFIRLVYNSDDRAKCSVLLQMDYKDYFFLREEEGMKKVILPNKAEIKTYGTGHPLKGLVGFSHPACDWGRCEKGESRETGLEAGEWEIIVNGVQATGSINIRKNVNFLKHSDGVYFTPNSDGQYEIQVRVNQVGAFVRLSSFIFL